MTPPDATADLSSHAPTRGPHPDGPTGDPSAGHTRHPADATPPHPPAVLPAVPGYELREEVGRGGMGVVYRARDLAFGRDVAVKLLQDRFPADGVAARRFADEARITGQLQHPGIPAAYQTGVLHDGRPFLAMKIIKGRTLDQLLASGGRQPGSDVLASGGREPPDPPAHQGADAPRSPSLVAAFEKVCEAVGYAHAHGVVHRDLKPANVMVGSYGEVQVMDWGLAKVLGGGGQPPEARDEEATAPGTEVRSARDLDDATQAGSVLGTAAFMPPEQAIGAVDEVDARSDVFGLGAVLCAVLTGRPPYAGESAESTRKLAARADLADAHTRLDGCGADPDLVALCRRCLSVKRADRPADGGEVARAVAAIRADADDRARRAERDKAAAEAEAREQRKRRICQQGQLHVAGAELHQHHKPLRRALGHGT
ncbi:MAG: serine/threonine protein kinase [Gemmataceae bacterium]|nr:serine/threonine protein kinase [Gemmataceae bacterium]